MTVSFERTLSMYNDPKDPGYTSNQEKDTPDARPLYESESDKRNNDPAGHRPRLPDTEGENVDPDDELNPYIKPTHNP
jgi:hypothetical protein